MKKLLIILTALAIVAFACGITGVEAKERPKIKAMFWDCEGIPWQHATEKVRVDLDNGQTVFLSVGEEMPQYYIYRFKIDNDDEQEKDFYWEVKWFDLCPSPDGTIIINYYEIKVQNLNQLLKQGWELQAPYDGKSGIYLKRKVCE